jgi:hypothetical protein
MILLCLSFGERVDQDHRKRFWIDAGHPEKHRFVRLATFHQSSWMCAWELCRFGHDNSFAERFLESFQKDSDFLGNNEEADRENQGWVGEAGSCFFA